MSKYGIQRDTAIKLLYLQNMPTGAYQNYILIYQNILKTI